MNKYEVRFNYNGGNCCTELVLENIENYIDDLFKANTLIINGSPTIAINMKNVNSISFTEMIK